MPFALDRVYLILGSYKAFKTLNFIYFTTITKQVIQLLLIILVGTDVCVRMVFVILYLPHIRNCRSGLKQWYVFLTTA